MAKQALKYLLVTIFLIISFNMKCEVKYFNNWNGYGDYSKGHNSVVSNGLITENSSGEIIYNVARFYVNDSNLDFEIRFANLNNKENKKSSYVTNGKKHSIMNSPWGIVWDYVDSLNYNSLELKTDNTYLGDAFDTRYMTVKTVKVRNGIPTILSSEKFKGYVDLYSGYNSVSFKVRNNHVTIAIGNKKLHLVGEYSDIWDDNNGNIGYFVGPGAKLEVEYIVVDYVAHPSNKINTDWTLEKLNKYFESHHGPHEGFWSYLDRNLDNSKLKLGGRYELAIIETDEGYDIIYVDGAKINGSKWKTGMIKGKLIKTNFQEQYNLIWYDANMLPFSLDVYGQFNDNNILELKFPIQKSVLRFSKK